MNPNIVEALKNATPEQVKEINRKLTKAIAKKLILGVAIGAAVGVALTVLVSAKNEDTTIEEMIAE